MVPRPGLAMLALLGACSWIAMPSVPPGGPSRDERVAKTCSTSTVAPDADNLGIAVGILGLAFSGLALAAAPGSDGNAVFGGDFLVGAALLVGVPSALITLGYVSSRRHGYRSARRCREERAKAPAPAPAPTPAPAKLSTAVAPLPPPTIEQAPPPKQVECVIGRRGEDWTATPHVHNAGTDTRRIEVVVRLTVATSPPEQYEHVRSVILAPGKSAQLDTFVTHHEILSCYVSLSSPTGAPVETE